ncbi:hypothetical protein, partial [Cellulomonas xylanilytica]|uniref:hypothetical protein n=1 Tax=Cellulomonas xylanilytica TaxID=233583 RepID=UPI001C995805
AVFGFGVGAVPGGAAGAIAGATFGLKILGVGFTLVSVGDFLDVVADWGEGKIDGQDLVKQGTLELALAITSLIGVGVVGKILQKTFKYLPASWRKKLEELLKKQEDNRTWRGTGTRDDPVVYEYSHPSYAFRDTPEPTAADLQRLGPYTDYEPGTREHLFARWVEYQTNGANKLSWEQWRNKYITIAGNRSRGAAYEQALRELLGYPATAPRSVKGATGIDRRFDILDEDKQLGIELKSGTTVKPDQLAKDTKLVRSGWTVKYIFGAEPDAETIAALTKAGIQWQVIHSTSVVR